MFHARVVRLKDGSEVEIRAARPSDAEAIIAHVNAVGAEEVFIATEHLDRSAEEQLTRLASFDGTHGLFLVAIRDGTLVGTADFLRGKPASKSGHVAAMGIAIQAPARGLGLGEAILRAGMDWGRQAGIRKVWLTVFASNTRAIALYRKLGFEQEGRLQRHVVLRGTETDELVMSKWLETT